MSTERIEAFSDGVIAILITIMVLELKVPVGADVAALQPMISTLLSYLLSFVYLGIYWNNHHHLLKAAERIDGRVMWANLHLLFWLSLVPFVTGWMGEHHFAPTPTAIYGVNMLMAAIAYWILQRTIVAADGPESKLAAALGNDFKGNISPVLYLAAIGGAFISSWISAALYVTVALIWIVPDRRLARVIAQPET